MATKPDPNWQPPLRNEKPWKYCGRCGSPMAWALRGEGFDRETGERGRIWVWSCVRWVEDGSKHERQEGTVHQKLGPAL